MTILRVSPYVSSLPHAKSYQYPLTVPKQNEGEICLLADGCLIRQRFAFDSPLGFNSYHQHCSLLNLFYEMVVGISLNSHYPCIMNHPDELLFTLHLWTGCPRR